MTRPASISTLLLTAGGLGFLRPAPGTWGSLPPAVAAAIMAWYGASPGIIVAVLVAFLVLFAIACVRYGDDAERLFGKKDPGSVVADEVSGQALTLLGVPWASCSGGTATDILLATGVAFLAFRALDILKPPPANGLQAIKGGLGILIDDLVAGLYAALVTFVVLRVVLAPT